MLKLEGLFTILIGICFVALCPRGTSDPSSLLGFRYFNERESYILTQRVLLDDPTKHQLHKTIPWAEIKSAVRRLEWFGSASKGLTFF